MTSAPSPLAARPLSAFDKGMMLLNAVISLWKILSDPQLRAACAYALEHVSEACLRSQLAFAKLVGDFQTGTGGPSPVALKLLLATAVPIVIFGHGTTKGVYRNHLGKCWLAVNAFWIALYTLYVVATWHAGVDMLWEDHVLVLADHCHALIILGTIGMAYFTTPRPERSPHFRFGSLAAGAAIFVLGLLGRSEVPANEKLMPVVAASAMCLLLVQLYRRDRAVIGLVLLASLYVPILMSRQQVPALFESFVYGFDIYFLVVSGLKIALALLVDRARSRRWPCWMPMPPMRAPRKDHYKLNCAPNRRLSLTSAVTANLRSGLDRGS